ncbi:cytochrome P450 [Apodospora peruviana]|uniref:Cytochrome P450 n=1 Tax=Apodospora peruviana TaxID=516989 RepID=A0AAE0HZA9_9PEZI|nr:cytochrome P450 [Apodospora peruviana]
MRSRLLKDLVAVDMDNTDESTRLGRVGLEIVLGVLILLLSTHCFTTCRYLLQSFRNRRYKGKEPSSLPYQLPGIGSAFQLVTNPHRFFDSIANRIKDGEPVRLRLGNLHAYLIHGSRNIQHVFRCSRDLTFEEFALRVAHKVKRLPAEDVALVAKDLSGSSRVPLTDVPSEDPSRIWRKFHEIYENHLIGGKAVSFLTDLFVGSLVKEIDSVPDNEWMQCGVDEFMKDKMFRASTIALAGPGVFDIDPDFTKNFWDYDHDFMSMLYGLPKFLCRKGCDARDSCLETTRRYLERGWRNIDWSATEREDPSWEPNFGSKLVREREAAMDRYGISLQGRASFQMGLIWSINSNAIPMTSWIIIEILRRPEVYQRIVAEIARVITKDVSMGVTTVDIPALKKLPLLNSVYLECLRLRSSVFVVRKLRNSIDVDGYTLKADNLILAPSYLAHKDPNVWATPQHPPEELWPERFMQPSTSSSKQTASNSTLNAGKYFPYGGGSAMCPGRNYAKQEILSAVALFFASFDIEVLHFVDRHGKPSNRGPEVGIEARGVARVDRDLLVRLRRMV